MKKKFLFGLSIGICIGATAQTQYHAVKQNTINRSNKIETSTTPSFYNSVTVKPINSTTSERSLTTKTKFSSSYNANGLLVTEQNCLTADQATNTISFTNRISQDWHPAGVNSGFISSTFTNDGGTTWDSILLVQDQTHFCRYPSATLFNPTGNTATSGLFAAVAGPITDNTNWVGNYFASSQLNNTNNHVSINLNATAGVAHQDFVRIGMQSAGNKVIVTGGLYKNSNGTTAVAQMYRGATINIGTFATNNFTWVVDSIKPNFYRKSTDLTPYAFSDAQTAWSQDGTIGYLIFSGVDSSATGAELSYQPMVWKTINGGTSWAQMPLTNFSAIPSINAKLIPSTGGTKKAWYTQSSGMSAAVDANNNLHIVNVIISGASDAPDSLEYSWTMANHVSYIYDTYTTSTGWDALLVDSLLCKTADANSPFSGGGPPVAKYTIDARIQVSRTTDGTHIFYLWTDSDSTAIAGENALPNIKGRGLNVTTSMLTPTVSFTNDGMNFYMYASKIALVNGSIYSIGATNSNSRDGSGNTDITFDHFFVSGIQFVESDFTIGIAVNGISENRNIASIAQNYPNPFSKETTISVNLSKASDLNITVSNLIGQELMVVTSGNAASGVHNFVIDGSKLSAGIYLYNVKAGDYSVTKKMVVQ